MFKAFFLLFASLLVLSQSLFATEIMLDGLKLQKVIEYFPTDKKFEPSGLAVDKQGRVWVISDNGRIGILDHKSRKIISKRMNRRGDYEGITFGPRGELFVVEEGADDIIKFTPNGMTSLAIYNIKRKFNGEKVIPKKGNGLESLAYYREDRKYWYFITTNQSKKIAKHVTDLYGTEKFSPDFFSDESMLADDFSINMSGTKDASAIIVIGISKLGSSNRIVEYYSVNIKDMSAVFYSKGNLFVVSDKENRLYHFQKNCCGIVLLDSFPLVGNNQEGIVIDGNGDIYIAQDSGSVIKLVLKNKIKLKNIYQGKE